MHFKYATAIRTHRFIQVLGFKAISFNSSLVMTRLKVSVNFLLRQVDAVSLKSIRSKNIGRIKPGRYDIRLNTSNTATYMYKTVWQLSIIDGVLLLNILS